MKGKRILFVANTTWNIYNFRLNLIQKFLKNDNEVFIAAPLDKYVFYAEKFRSVTHVNLKRLNRDHTHPVNDFLSVFELKKVYKDIDPDVIIHYTHKANIFGCIAAWLSEKKCIAVVTGLGYPFLHGGFLKWFTKQLYKSIRNRYSKIIFENEDDLKYFVNANLSKISKSTFVNGCGVDTDVYKPSRKHLKSTKFVFTFIGRLLKDKGINEFLQAAEKLSKSDNQVEFRIVGEFDEGNPSMVKKKELQRLVDKGIVDYLGFVSDVRPQISQSNCIVLPSYREGMPRVILEALAMAKPVITTDVPGCRQTVDHGINGYLVKHMDSTSLSLGMQKILGLSKKELQIMGQKGREKALKHFNSEKISSELYEIVSQVYFCG